MSNNIDIKMQANVDSAVAAFHQATSGLDDVSNALIRLIQQQRASDALAIAEHRFQGMSEAEKQAAIDAYEYMNAQKAAAAQTEAAGNAAGGLKMAWTEFSSMINVVEQGLQAAGKVYNATIGATYEYALQVDKLSRTIGATAEESSKLIQAGDDLGLSYDAISTAMEGAIRKGYEPTIEGLGKIADKYNSIQDPIERTKFLMDTFGRTGADIAELMEQGSAGIDAMGKAAEAAGLVMGPDAIADAKEYRTAVDDLGDAWMGLKIKIGTGALPLATDTIKAAMKTAENPSPNWFGGYSDAVEFVKEIIRLEKERNAVEEAAKAGIGVQADMNEKLYGMRDAVEQIDFNKLETGINIDSGPARAAADELERVKSSVEAFNSIDISFGSKIAAELDKIAFQQAGGDKIQQAFEQVKAAVDAGKITPEEAQGMYQELLTASEAVKVKMGEINPHQAAQNIQKELGGSLTDSKKRVDDIIKRLNDIPSHITTELDIIINQSGGTVVGDGGSDGGGRGNEPEVIGGRVPDVVIADGGKSPGFANYGVQNFTLTGKATLDSLLREMRL